MSRLQHDAQHASCFVTEAQPDRSGGLGCINSLIVMIGSTLEEAAEWRFGYNEHNLVDTQYGGRRTCLSRAAGSRRQQSIDEGAYLACTGGVHLVVGMQEAFGVSSEPSKPGLWPRS